MSLPLPAGTITNSTSRVEEEVQIVIRETGASIPDEIRARIFDPFFTTEDAGRRTVGLIVLPLYPATPLEAAA